MFYPEDIQHMRGRDFDVSDTAVGLLRNLKDEVHGPGGDPLSHWTTQYFFQDEPQLEEGKSLDSQVCRHPLAAQSTVRLGEIPRRLS